MKSRKTGSNLIKFSILLLTIVGVIGCSISSEFSKTGSSYSKSNRSVDDIEIFFGGDRPKGEFKIVGILSTDWPWKGLTANRNSVFQAMRKEAAKNGLDGILDVECAGSGVRGEGLCTGKGFVYAN